MNKITDYIEGTAKCDLCEKSVLTSNDILVTATALWESGWRGAAFGFDPSAGSHCIQAGSADEEATLFCPECSNRDSGRNLGPELNDW